MKQNAVRHSIPAPEHCSTKYGNGWRRGDHWAVYGGDLKADGPQKADDETWTGYIDALAAHARIEVGAAA